MTKFVSKFFQTSTSTSPTGILDLETLTFIPQCNITSREAVSAIQRAKTQHCKKLLADTACKIATDTLYPKNLHRQCYNNGELLIVFRKLLVIVNFRILATTYKKHVGCFRDDKKQRILPDSFQILKETNSQIVCIDLCLQSGYEYAGVQYGYIITFSNVFLVDLCMDVCFYLQR